MSRKNVLSRRQFATGVTASATTAILTACGGGATGESGTPATKPPVPTANGATTATTATIPATITSASSAAAPQIGTAGAVPSVNLVDGQIPSGIVGVPDAYTKPPTRFFQATPNIPGKGGTVKVFSILYGTPPVRRTENRYWQELEKRLGVTWEPTLAPSVSFGEKSAAVTAGGDLGDLFYLNPDQNADAQRQLIQQGAFADLTPYLSGDGLKEFPNLARYPDYLWKNVAFKGKIYGVPKPVLRGGNIGFYRSDWLQKLHLSYPKNADDTYNMLVAFSKNHPGGNGQETFGATSSGPNPWSVLVWGGIFRAPNEWRLNPDGTLTRNLETDEYRQAVEFAHRLYTGGAFHPDAAGMNSDQERDLWRAARLGIHSEGFIAFWGNKGPITYMHQNVPDAAIDGFIPPGFDGGHGVTNNLSGFFGFTAVPTKVGKDKERTKELLRILDYLAAPFGSEEYNFIYYGVDGWDNDVQPDGSRIVNDQGRSELGGLVYMMQSEYSFYYPGAPGDAERAQAIDKQSLALGIDNPTYGLSSATNNAKGAELTQLRIDRTTAFVTGREPMSAYDQYIKDWRSRGGDTIRKEFEQAIKEAKSAM